MKTTVEIDDHLFRRARQEARRRKTTLRRLIEEGLRRELAPQKDRRRYRMRDGSFREGTGLQPGVDLADWTRTIDLIYEDRGA